MSKEAASRVESRDAVVWDVLADIRLCRVKVQGSDEYIICHYPENWEQTPVWLKPGNAVRVVHRGGVRGFMEIVGHGQCVPTTVPGALNPSTPDTPPSPNVIMSGGTVVEIPTGPQMAVMILTGMYRYNQDIKIIPRIKMSDPSDYNMTMGGKMGQISAVFAVTAPALKYRMDRVVMNGNGIISYLTGVEVNSNPVAPSIPANNFSLGTVFVRHESTAIYQSDINASYSAPAPQILEATPAKASLAITDLTTTITVRVKDQYNTYMSAPYGGWQIQGKVTSGTGTLTVPYIVGTITGTTVKGNMVGNSLVFTYNRVPGTEVSPYVEFSLVSSTGVVYMLMLSLLDADGNVLI